MVVQALCRVLREGKGEVSRDRKQHILYLSCPATNIFFMKYTQNAYASRVQNPENQLRFCMRHCLTRSDVTCVEGGVRMSQCVQAPLGMRIEGVGDSHFS